MTTRYQTRLDLFGPLPVNGISTDHLKGIRREQLVGRFVVNMRADAAGADEAAAVMHEEAWRTFRPQRAPQRSAPVLTLEDRAAVASGPRVWAAQRTTAELLAGDHGCSESRDALEAWVTDARTEIAARMAGRPGSKEFKRSGGYLRVQGAPAGVQLARINSWAEAWDNGLASRHAAIAATAGIASRVLPAMDPEIVPQALLDGIHDALSDSLFVGGPGEIRTCDRSDKATATLEPLSALEASMEASMDALEASMEASMDALERIRVLVVAAERANRRRAREFRAEARTAAHDVVSSLQLPWAHARGSMLVAPHHP